MEGDKQDEVGKEISIRKEDEESQERKEDEGETKMDSW